MHKKKTCTRILQVFFLAQKLAEFLCKFFSCASLVCPVILFLFYFIVNGRTALVADLAREEGDMLLVS